MIQILLQKYKGFKGPNPESNLKLNWNFCVSRKYVGVGLDAETASNFKFQTSSHKRDATLKV